MRLLAILLLILLIPSTYAQIYNPNPISNYSQLPISHGLLYPLNPNQLQQRNYTESPRHELTNNNTQETKIVQTDTKYCVQFCIDKNLVKIIGVILGLIILLIIVWIVRKSFWI